MDTTIVSWGIYWGFIRIMERKMETTTCKVLSLAEHYPSMILRQLQLTNYTPKPIIDGFGADGIL